MASSALQLRRLPNTMRAACAGAYKVDNLDPTRTLVFRAKIDAFIKELLKVKERDPAAKSIVFSAFTSGLAFLKNELPRHGLQLKMVDSNMNPQQRTRAIEAFQHDPPTTVFLLNTNVAAVGITLTSANHVWLLEPSDTPFTEQQTISRARRMGQTREVFVHRMVVTDSIEERIRTRFHNRTAADEAAGKSSVEDLAALLL